MIKEQTSCALSFLCCVALSDLIWFDGHYCFSDEGFRFMGR